MKRVATAMLVAMGCAQAPERVHIILAESPVAVRAEGTTFRPEAPLRADNYVVGVCVEPPGNWDLRDDWTIAPQGQPGVRVTAEAILTSGRIVKLSQASWSTALCLHPAQGGPLPEPVQEVKVRSSRPFTASRVWWQSTDK